MPEIEKKTQDAPLPYVARGFSVGMMYITGI
jgi:hypothetical protein